MTRPLLKITAANCLTPGSNPNGNGIWTDDSVDGYVVVMGRKN